MSAVDTLVTNAVNVVCHIAGNRLTFFVNLTRRASAASLGTVKDGTIYFRQGEELPYTVTFNLFNYGGAINTAKTLATLRNYMGSHSIVKGATEADGAPYWALESDELLSIKVDTSGFYDVVAAAASGTVVKLIHAKSRVATCYGVELNITCPAKAPFPRSYLQSISNPRLSDSPSRMDAVAAEESSGENPYRSPPAVARQLNMDSRTPETIQRQRRAQLPALGDEELLPPSHVHDHRGQRSRHTTTTNSTLDALAHPGELIRQDDTLTIDATSRRNIRLLFYPAHCGGNLFKRDFPVLGDIGVQLLIEIADEDDRRVAPKREPKRPSSSSSFSLRNTSKAQEQRNKQKATNVTADLQTDPVRNEKVLVIAFNGEETHNVVDMEYLLTEGGYAAGGTAGAGGRGKSLIVANCSNLVSANYIIDLSAVRVESQMPGEREVYIAVNSYFYQHGYVGFDEDDEEDEEEEEDFYNDPRPRMDPGQRRQYTLDMLKTMALQDVREYLFQQYSYFVERATLEERQNFSSLVWSCTRDCIINKVFGRREPLLEDVDNAVSDMLQA